MSRHRSILCVDADGFGLQVRRLVLETFGHRVFAFTRSDEALRAFTNHHIDLVMLDQELEEKFPGTAQAFKTLRPKVPILMLSSQVYPPARAITHIDGFITKGEAPQRLLAEISNTVNRAARRHHRIRPLLWATGAVATCAAWFAAKALHKRMHQDHALAAAPKKPPVPSDPPPHAKSARA